MVKDLLGTLMYGNVYRASGPMTVEFRGKRTRVFALATNGDDVRSILIESSGGWPRDAHYDDRLKRHLDSGVRYWWIVGDFIKTVKFTCPMEMVK